MNAAAPAPIAIHSAVEIDTSAPAGNAAESLGREHQARGRTQPQQGWTALLRARVDSGAA